MADRWVMVPSKCCCGAGNWSKHGRLPAPAEEHAEPRSAASSVGNRTTRQNDGRRHPTSCAERQVGRANDLQVCLASHVPMQTWFGYPPEVVSPVEASRSR